MFFCIKKHSSGLFSQTLHPRRNLEFIDCFQKAKNKIIKHKTNSHSNAILITKQKVNTINQKSNTQL